MKQPILCSLRTACVSALLACLFIPALKAEQLAATHVDFSTAGFTGAATAQTPINGFTYGYYTGANATTEGGGVSFSTAGMGIGSFNGASEWSGPQSGTPAHNPYVGIHPALNTLNSVVRRYVVGAGGEPSYTGQVRIVGSYWDLNSGQTSGFITVDGVVKFPRTAVNGPVPFDLTADVVPGTKIDFGVTADGDGASSDATGFNAWIVTGDTAVPTNVVANAFSSPYAYAGAGAQNVRLTCFSTITDGIVSSTDGGTFDTSPGGAAFPYAFGGLLYLENSGSGKATRFDSVGIDVTTSGDFSETPRLYLLRHNSDPNTSNPAADDRYVRLPILPTRTASNSAGQPAYTFDLSSLTEEERTGYGFAVVGAGLYQGNAIVVSEISATAVRVADSGVIAPQPFFVQWTNNHRYALSMIRGNWDQAEAEAVSVGGHLLSLNSTQENDFITNTFGFTEEFFIGLRQNLSSPTFSEPAGGFEWVNGDAVTFTNWHGGEPNHAYGAGEDYAVIGGFQTPTGTWGDVKKAGFPETSNYRGIIELPTPGAGEQNFYLPQILARSNIFDAGLASATQGGVLPPSLGVAASAGQVISFPQIVGVINTAADVHGPDGAHTAGRSCDLSGVGGISGYLNGNNTPALVGVFLGATQPAQQPARLDFSTNALGEDFTTLTPALGQVFFIGDGFTSAGEAQEFIIPAGAERLYFGIADGNSSNTLDNATLYHGTPKFYGDNSGSVSLRATVMSNSTPFFASTNFPAEGGKLEANGGTGPYTFAVTGGNLPPHLSLTTLNNETYVTSSGQPRVNGSYTFTVRVTDSANATADMQFTVVVAGPVDVPSGIVAWWPGENAVNEIIGGRHGSLSDPAATLTNYREGKVGTSFSFSGADAFVLAEHHSSLSLTGAAGLTIEAWVEATATNGNRTIIDKRSADGSTVSYILQLSNGVIRFIASTTSGASGQVNSGVVFPSGLHHLGVTVEGSNARIYLDGVLVHETNTFPTARAATDGPLTIGAARNQTFVLNPFEGVIDELSLYNRALTAGEISAIHAAGAAGKKRVDAAIDFSPTQNPNGVWSYRELPSTASLASYNPAEATLLTTPSVAHGGRIDFWSTNASVTRNHSEDFVEIQSGGSQYDWNLAELGWGPGSGSQRPVVRWTAPISGRYAVSANFTNTDTTPTGTDVFIRHGSTAVFDSFVTAYRGNGVSHTSAITVAAGDTVDFILGTRGNVNYDSAALAASVAFLSSTPLALAADFPAQPADPQTPWQPLTVTGGTGPYTFTVTNGALPAALVLAQNGGISGTLAATPGRTTFTVTVTDALGASVSKEYTLGVAQEFALPLGATTWFPGELHPHDVVGGALGVTSGFPASGPYGVGKSGTGFVFDGMDDALTVSNNAALNALPLTIEAWIKPELRSGNSADFWPTNIISGDRAQFGGHGIGANVFADGSHLWIEVQHTSPGQAFRQVSGDHFRAGEWAHVALVLTSGNAKTYVNGSLVDDFNFSQGAMDADPFFRIGRHNEDAGYPVGQRFFKGAIDEVTTYNRALSAAEILNIVNADWIGKNRDDAARDFFTQTNVAGQLWQYGQMGTGLAPVGTTFARYATADSENALRYWRDGAAPDPNVIKNTGDVPYLHWAPGQLSVHPGPGPERIFSAVRWTAPAPGRYAFFSEYSRLNTQVGTASIHLFKGENSFGSKTITDTLRKDTLFGTSFVQAGETVDFVVGSRDDFGFDAVGITPSVALLEAAPRLPEITNLGIQTKFPASNLSLWHFTATRAPDPAGVTSTLALQFSATPEIESSWTALQTVFSSSLLINKPAGSNVWLADATLSFTPGSYYFRIVQSAAGYATATSAVFGNEALIGGNSDPGPVVIGEVQPPTAVTNLKITTAKPPAAGKKWSFQVDYPRDAVLLLVQYSLTPNDPASWSYLPGDAALVRPDANGKAPATWTLDVSRLSIPGGNVFFRIESTTSLLGGQSSYSAPFGAEAIAGAKAGTTGPILVKNPAKLTVDMQAKLWVNSNGTPIENNLVHIGEEIAYEISYRNHGEAVATGVSITVMVPPQLELISAAGTTSPIRKNPRDPNSEIVGVRLDIGTLSPSQNFQRRRIIARVRDDAKKPGRGVVNLLGTALIESPDFPDQKLNLPVLAVADSLRVGLRVAGSEFEFPKGATIPLIFTVENKSPAALTNAVASVKIPAGAYVDSFLNDNQASAERVFDKVGKTIELKFNFGAMPANTSRFVSLNLRTPFDAERNVIFTGNPTKDDPGYTFTAFNAVAKKTLVAIGDGFSVNLTNAIVRPPQLDLGKEVTGATLQGRQTFGIPYKESAKDQERLVRGAIVAPSGEVTFTLNYRNAGEGTAKACEVFDDIDSRYFTLVPDSIRLNGQPVSIGSTVRLFKGVTPIGPNETLQDLRLANFFKIRVGDLGAGEGGVFSYRVVAAKYAAKKLTPTEPGRTVGAGPGSFFTESLVGGIGGQPEVLAVQVLKPHEFRLEYKRQPGFARAGNVLRFGLKYSNAGQLPAYNAFINLPIPTGTTGHSAFFVHTDTAEERERASDETLPPDFTGATTPQRFELGTLDPGETGEIAIYLTVNAPLNQAIVTAGEVRVLPFIDAFQTARTTLRTPRGNHRLREELQKPAGALKIAGAIPVAVPSAPKLFIGRSLPITATKGGTMDVTVFFGNAGDNPATGANVAMQIPFETTLESASVVQMTRPSDPSNQTNLTDTRYTLTTRTEKKGSRIERIIVDLPTLPGHSSGAFTMKLKVAEKFGGAAVEDSSCRIVANNAPGWAAHPFVTQVRSAEWYFSIFESVNASIWSFGGWVAGQHKATVQEEFKALTVNSQFSSLRGLDFVPLRNGANFAPTGFNRGLIFGPSRLVAAGGGNLVAAGGLNLVAAGGGNLIGIKNVPGFSGTATLSQLVPAIPRLVAAGGGNLVAAGGGNLIGLDGSTLIGNDGSTLVGNDGASLIGNDGSTLIGNDGSTMVGLNNAQLIGLDGSTFATISMDGGSPRFTPVDGGPAIRATFRPANAVPTGAGSLVAAGGGNLVAAGGGNLVAAGGGNLVAAGGGNVLSHNGSTLVAAGGGN